MILRACNPESLAPGELLGERRPHLKEEPATLRIYNMLTGRPAAVSIAAVTQKAATIARSSRLSGLLIAGN